MEEEWILGVETEAGEEGTERRGKRGKLWPDIKLIN